MCGRGLVHGLAQDRADGPGAASAFRTAAEAAIDLRGGAGTARTRLQARAHLSVGEDVARADNHAGDRNLSCLSEMPTRENRRTRSLPIIHAAQGHRKPADLRRTQIRMIENFNLFRTLAIEAATGNSGRARLNAARVFTAPSHRSLSRHRDRDAPGRTSSATRRNRAAKRRRSGRRPSMRHQHGHGRVRQDVAGRAAENHLA